METRLATLQSPIPETPLHCVNEECSRVPQCFTNYQPHFALSPQRQDLDRILVGEHLGWYVEAAPGNDLNPELGLLDKKFYYRVRALSPFTELVEFTIACKEMKFHWILLGACDRSEGSIVF